VNTKTVIHVGAAALSVLIPFGSDDIPMGFAYHFGIASLHLFEPLVVVRQVGLSSSSGRLCERELSMAITDCMPNTVVCPLRK